MAMERRLVLFGFLLILTSGWVLRCPADEIVLKNGIRVQGEIRSADFEKVVIVTAGGKPMTYNRQDVKTLTRTEPESFATAQGLVANGDYAGAVKIYEEALKGTPSPWQVENARAKLLECYSAAGQWDKAASQYLVLVKESPGTPYLVCLPVAKDRGQVTAEALGALDKSSAGLSGLAAAAARALKCQALAIIERPADAKRELDALAAINEPRAAKLATVCQSHLLFSQKQYDKALDLLARAVAGNDGSESPWLAFWQGQCYYAKQDYARAALAFLRAPLLDAQFGFIAGDCLYMAGQCFEKLGQKDKATGAYQDVAQKHPTSRFSKEAKQALASLQSSTKGK
jgi:TolA-binding protein